MESNGALGLHSSTWTGFEKTGRSPNCLLRIPQRHAEKVLFQKIGSGYLRSNGASVSRRDKLALKVYCSYKKSGGSALEAESVHASIDEALILKREVEEVAPCLCGRCVYLVGMMGAGKTTVGKILSEALGYSFFDSDKLVEQAVGGTSVAQIFKEHSEAFFRDNESKVLRDLSSMRQLVVATGGGAVIRPINWRYMKKGVTVWLDVPLEALARRIAAVGTASRPLLHQESGDAYTKALSRLRALYEERGEAYANADARVSLENMAVKQDVNALTPTAIATEALIRIEEFLRTSRVEEAHVSRDEA